MTTENPCSAIGGFSYHLSLTDGVVLWEYWVTINPHDYRQDT
ncbi:MAG TPA: hypothetical protein VLD64_01875 [Nitrosarchaeum sp.]|nr:hypothetical protein [Nitrosarchaeum sp.]